MVAVACGGSSAPAAENLDFAARSWPEAAAAPCSGGAIGFAQIRSIDKQTVEFQLCAPDPAFLQKIALPTVGIQDSGYLKAHATDGLLSTAPNGTGPYSLQSWQRGVQIVLNRFDDYWGEKAKAKTAVLQWQTDAAARLLALQSGTVDGIDNVAPEDSAAIEGDLTLKLYPRQALNTMYIGMNNTFKPFDDVRVRKAIALALDRQRIVDLFYPAGSEAASHYVPCSLEFGCEGDALYGQNIDEAKRLLAEAGFPDGFSTTLSLRDVVRSYLPAPQAVATDIQEQLAAIGVRVTLDVQESTSYFDNVLSGKVAGLFIFAWVPDFPDTSNFVFGQFTTNAGPVLGSTYEALNAAAVAAVNESASSKRKALYAQVNKLINELAPFVPIAHGGSALAFKADVRGAYTSPLLTEQLALITPGGRESLVFVQGAEPGGLYCADEEDGESLRACAQIQESLYGFDSGSMVASPRLATSCTVSDDLLTWTCTLRNDVKFHNGAVLDASDVVDTFAAIWDCAHPYHVGRTGTFGGWGSLWGAFLSQESCISGE
jgi:hypothetical protein